MEKGEARFVGRSCTIGRSALDCRTGARNLGVQARSSLSGDRGIFVTRRGIVEGRIEPTIENRRRGEGFARSLQDRTVLYRGRDGETCKEIACGSVHHFHIATGSRPEIGLLRGSNHDGGSTAL